MRRIDLRLRGLLGDRRGQAVIPYIDRIVDMFWKDTVGGGNPAPNLLTDEKPPYKTE